MKKQQKNHIIITGMHRSGTSFLARAFNLCGLNLGPLSDFYDYEISPIKGNACSHNVPSKSTAKIIITLS